MNSHLIGKPFHASHRFRLSLWVATGSGVMLSILFWLAVQSFYTQGLEASKKSLAPAMAFARHECHKRPQNPELFEVTETYPDISFALFDSHHRLVAKSGSLQLTPLSGESVGRVLGIEVAYSTRTVGDELLVGGLPLTNLQNARSHLAQTLSGLWVLLVMAFGGITWLAAGATFRPLLRLANRAETLGHRNLSERLGVGEEGEYAAFADSLNRFLDRLEESVRREEQFVADAAHELRTPLTVLRGEVETTLKRNRTSDEYQSCLKTVLAESNRLSALVESLLLSASKADAGAETLCVEEQAERIHARWVDRFAEHGVQLTLSLAPTLARLSPIELDVILDNLLSNALKASEPSTTCHLVVKSQGGRAFLEVLDEGPGIPEASRERIFDRFARGDEGRNRTMGGFGVGLAVCRRIVENRSGRIFVGDSDKGARFVVELPAN